MHERVMGPVHGRYLASFAARMGQRGERWLGYWKLCDVRPGEFFAAPAVATGHCAATAASAEAALMQAEELALAALRNLPAGPCSPAADEPLAALMYVSSAAAAARLDADVMLGLLVSARTRNHALGLGGVLLAFNGRFMQYLEGPQAQLELVYRSIQANPLHHGLVELLREPIARREFDGWQLAFGAPELLGHDPRDILPALYEGDSLPRSLLRRFLQGNQ